MKTLAVVIHARLESTRVPKKHLRDLGDGKTLIDVAINNISKLKNHYIICGYGRMGAVIARELDDKNQKFLIIENNEQKIEKTSKKSNKSSYSKKKKTKKPKIRPLTESLKPKIRPGDVRDNPDRGKTY